MPLVKELLAREVDRNIEEVIKVDQDDASIIKGEIEEYVRAVSRKVFPWE